MKNYYNNIYEMQKDLVKYQKRQTNYEIEQCKTRIKFLTLRLQELESN